MEEHAKSNAERWDSTLESLDLLFAKVEEIERNQHKVEMKVDMSNKVVGRMIKDQQLMAKQLEATDQAIAKLTIDHMKSRDEAPSSHTDSDTAADNPSTSKISGAGGSHNQKRPHNGFGDKSTYKRTSE
jgi:hypothetical protein